MTIRGETPLDGLMKMREDFIKIAASYGRKLHELRSKGFNPQIAVLKGGGMALQFVKETKERGYHYRLGSVVHPDIACTIQKVVDQWNRENPNHELGLIPIQQAVERECASVCIMLSTIEQRREELEARG